MYTKRLIRKHFFFIAIMAIVALAVCLSIKYDLEKHGDCTTMLSGLWSALATIILGVIAINQAKSFKRETDRQSDLVNMPEMYELSPFDSIRVFTQNPIETRQNILSIKVNGISHDKYFIQTIHFGVIKTPILFVRPIAIYFDKELISSDFKDTENFSIFKDSDILTMQVAVPIEYESGNHCCILLLGYENLYGTKYLKHIIFDLKDGKIDNIKNLISERVPENDFSLYQLRKHG